jgi:hypothetical protein
MSKKPVVINTDGLAQRYAVWRQLIDDPDRDARDIVMVCAEQGIDTDVHYVRCTRARWRDTINVLKEAGAAVPA